MRNEKTPKENSTSAITPSSPWRIRKVRPLENYRLYVKFMDGIEGFVDLSHLIKSDNAGVFTALSDFTLFKKVYLDHGAVAWPGELDLAPDAMYEIIKERGEWILQ